MGVVAALFPELPSAGKQGECPCTHWSMPDESRRQERLMGHHSFTLRTERPPEWKRSLGDKAVGSKLYSCLFVCLFGYRGGETRGFMHAPQVL